MLVPIKSLSTLSFVFHSGSLGLFWNGGGGDFLIKYASLKKLSLTFIFECEPYHGFDGLDYVLAITTSLDRLSLAIFVNYYAFCERFKPRSHFKSRLSLIVQVNVVLNRTVAVDSDCVSTTCAVVIFRVKGSSILSVDGVILLLLI